MLTDDRAEAPASGRRPMESLPGHAFWHAFHTITRSTGAQ